MNELTEEEKDLISNHRFTRGLTPELAKGVQGVEEEVQELLERLMEDREVWLGEAVGKLVDLLDREVEELKMHEALIVNQIYKLTNATTVEQKKYSRLIQNPFGVSASPFPYANYFVIQEKMKALLADRLGMKKG